MIESAGAVEIYRQMTSIFIYRSLYVTCIIKTMIKQCFGFGLVWWNSVEKLVALVDKSNGFVFAGLRQHHKPGEALPEMAYTATITESEYDRTMSAHHKYVGHECEDTQ